MTSQNFDHERLDFCRSTALLGNSRRHNDSKGLIDMLAIIARGSALECAAVQGALVTTKSIKVQDDTTMKVILQRIVAMLTRMAMEFDGLVESGEEYNPEIDYDYEHRCAEHEHDSQPRECPASGLETL